MNYSRPKPFRITYKRLTDAVNAWNHNNGKKPRDKGFLKVGNDGNNHFLLFNFKQDSSACRQISGTDCTLKSCYQVLNHLTLQEVMENCD